MPALPTEEQINETLDGIVGMLPEVRHAETLRTLAGHAVATLGAIYQRFRDVHASVAMARINGDADMRLEAVYTVRETGEELAAKLRLCQAGVADALAALEGLAAMTEALVETLPVRPVPPVSDDEEGGND